MKDPKVKNIIFDLGNTLIFFDFAYFYDGLKNIEKNLNIHAFRRYIIKNKLGDKLCTGRITFAHYFKILKKKFKLQTSYADFKCLYSDIFWENKEMHKFLSEVSQKKRRYKIFLFSNTDAAHINYIYHNFPFIKHIRNKFLSFKVNSLKPEKKIFRIFLDRYKVIPEECVFIDDMRPNIKTIQAMNFNAIHYKSHKKFLREFTKLVG